MDETSKVRSDAWDATLSEAQRWQVYDLFRRVPWYQVAEYVEREFSVRRPGRNALYCWAARMRKQESGHRVEEAVTASAEAGQLAATVTTDETLINAFKSMASIYALRNNAAEAIKYTQMALDIMAAQTKGVELRIKAEAQRTKESTLKLAREKFEAAEARLQRAADAVKKLNTSGALTAEARAEIEKAMGLL